MLLDGFGPAAILLKYPTLEEFFFQNFMAKQIQKLSFCTLKSLL